MSVRMSCGHYRYAFVLVVLVSARATDVDDTCESTDGALVASESDPYIQRIIHATSAVAALADGSLAQIPGLGKAVVPVIQAGMIAIIGRHYGCHLDASNAMALVTFFASNHAKKALVKEVVGFVPMFGNIVKSAITGFMTEGIGNLADSMLRCQSNVDNLFDHVPPIAPEAAESARGLFHAMSEYLSRGDLTSSTSAREMWDRVSQQLFSGRNQAQLLEEIEAAPAPELAIILTKHKWNLEVVAAVLNTLRLRFTSGEDKCSVVNDVSKEWWSTAGSDIEAKSITAQYLSECLSYASSETRSLIAKNCARLLVETRGGSKGYLAPQMIGYILELVSLTADETIAAPEEMAVESLEDLEADLVLENKVKFVKGSTVHVRPSLPLSEILSTYTAAMTALKSGHETACDAMRALLRAEQSALRASNNMPKRSMAASVRDLERIGNMEAPGRSAICLPSLQADLQRILTSDELTSQVERASEVVPSEAIVNGRGQLEDILNSAIVGQPCAVKRVTKHARLRMGGFWGQDKPLVVLLTGPSGTGKTLMARNLAEVLLGQPIAELEASQRFRTFHMNTFSMIEDQKSFFGPPKGIVGKGDLPELLKMWPDAVILLDEVEKAHPSFARALLKVLGENGAVYDPQTSKDISSVGATFLLTSNLAKDLILDRGMTSKDILTIDPDCNNYEALREEVMQALRAPRVGGRDNFFKESEVRGRLYDVLPFLPFGRSEIENAVRRFLSSESAMFEKSPQFLHVSLSWEPEVVAFLSAEYAQRPDEGLRGVHTQLQGQVREILQLAMEAGLVTKFSEVTLWVRRSFPSSLDLRVSSANAKLDAKHDDVHGTSSTKDTYPNSGNSQIWPGWMFSTSLGISERSGSSDMSGAEGEGSNAQWLWAQDWDWELFWQQVLDWAFEHWYYVALSGAALIAVVLVAPLGATAVAPVAGAAVAAPMVLVPAPVVLAAAPTAAPAAIAGLSGIFALVFPIGVTAATFFTASYVWNNRFLITAAAVFCGIAALVLPSLLKSLCRRCAAWIWSSPREGKEKRRTSRLVQKLSGRRRNKLEILRRRRSLQTHGNEPHTAKVVEHASSKTFEENIFSTPRGDPDSPLQEPAKVRRQADLCSSPDSEDRASNASARSHRSSNTDDSSSKKRRLNALSEQDVGRFRANPHLVTSSNACDSVGELLSVPAVPASMRRHSIASEVVQREQVVCACRVVSLSDDPFCGNCGLKRPKPKAD